MQKKYNVHVFTVVRVKMEPVEAESQTDAIKKSLELLGDQTYFLFDRIPAAQYKGVADIEDAEEISHFLVDEVGDEEHENSRFYKADGITIDTVNP